MSECRQELMAQGKPYPRSGCDKCGQWAPKSKECDAKLEADRKASEWEDTFGPDYTGEVEKMCDCNQGRLPCTCKG